jgi:hypothetical protein
VAEAAVAVGTVAPAPKAAATAAMVAAELVSMAKAVIMVTMVPLPLVQRLAVMEGMGVPAATAEA